MKFAIRRWCMLAILASLFAAMAGAPLLAGPDEGKKPSKKKEDEKKKEDKKKKPAAPKGFKNAPKERAKYVVDDSSDRNEISFKSNIPGHVITGTSKQAGGELEFNPRLIKDISGSFSVPWISLDTGNSNRNEHMRSSPWVNANAHPDIVFTVSGIESLKAGNKSGTVLKGKLVGTFAINGAEKEIKIPATLAYIGGKKSKKTTEDDQAEAVTEGVGIQAKFNVKLADFNIEGRGVGDKVAATQNIKVSLFLKRIIEETPTEPTPAPRPRTRIRRAPQN